MKVLVFGGNGFLGSYLTEALLESGHAVTVADLHNDPPTPAGFVSCDILDRRQVLEAIAPGTEVVYNLAGFANLDRAVEAPHETLQLNVMGNLHVLQACVDRGVRRFVYASSAYALSNKGSFYGISKLTSEKLTEEYFKKYGLSYTILRYGSVYAERDVDNNYIFSVVKEAIRTGKIVHGGDGEEQREYIHARDAARLSVDILEERFTNQHVILTGTERMRRLDLFRMIEEILGKPLDIQLNKEGYQGHYRLTPYSFNPTMSKKLIANPHIDMGQGLLECIRVASGGV